MIPAIYGGLILVGMLVAYATGKRRAERAKEMSREKAQPEEVQEHKKALRYFLRNETSLGMWIGAYELPDVRAAMRVFADTDWPEPKGRE